MTYEEYSEIRDSLGYKDGQVASATGIGRSTFSDWKSGRSCPKQEKMKKIMDFLHINIDSAPATSDTLVTKQLLLAEEDLYFLRDLHSLSPDQRKLVNAFIDALTQANHE